MTITTKFSLGQTVWVMKDNKAKEFTIKTVEVCAHMDAKLLVKYSLDGYGPKSYDGSLVLEYMCFATKEELLKSL